MATAIELLRQGRRDELWKKYCGFLDLSLEEFMKIQERLLMEQIALLSKCALGRKLLRNKTPTSVEEFRRVVPLTTYQDYIPDLIEQKEEGLPAKPYTWVRTSGRSGEYGCKWVPYSERMFESATRMALAGVLLTSCSKKGEIVLEENATILNTLAPLPYVSGVLTEGLLTQFPFRIIPPIAASQKLEFQERIKEGLKIALETGVDVMYGLASVLVRVGEQFGQGGSLQMSSYYLRPRVLFRLIRGLIMAKLAGRNLLPKDLWDIKCLGAAGMDMALFKDKIMEYWGKGPAEGYAGAEITVVATQLWTRKGMTFYPEPNLLEFIPEDEHIKGKKQPTYQPRTVLLNEVKPGERYEIVITNFYGGVFVRYRPGDLIEIVALRDDEAGVDIPQMVFYARADDIIDIAGFTRLTEKAIGRAVHDTGVPYVDWTARKETEAGQPVLRLYIELKEDVDLKELEASIHKHLKEIDSDYNDLSKMLGLNPLRLTSLPRGTFMRYFLMMKEAGVDAAHFKPPRMSPSNEVIRKLLVASEQL